MDIKEFLKPDWKKLILPFILIILYIYIVAFSSRVGQLMDTYMCDSFSLNRKITEAYQNNETDKIDQYKEEMNYLSGKMRTASENLDIDNIVVIYNFMKFINPVMPLPCELESTNFCAHYASKETYDCFVDFEDYLKGPSASVTAGLLSPTAMVEYRKSTFFTHVFSIIVLIIEGYLVSALVVFLYKKIKNRTSEKEV